jgi:hypothetical protein
MRKQNPLVWVNDPDNKNILVRAISTDDMFWFEIQEFERGEGDEEYYYCLFAEGTLLCDGDTIQECKLKAQRIQDTIDGVDE